MIKKLVENSCAKCGKKVEYFVIFNEDNSLNLANYNHFKRPLINRCPNCGYINDDLNVNNEFYQDIKLNIKDSDDIKTNLLNNIKLDRTYIKSLIEKDKIIRVLANIFENNKFLLNSFLRDNYTKKDEQTSLIIKELNSNVKNSAQEILDFINNNNLTDNFIDILKIEVLCHLNQTKDAETLLNSIKNLPTDLLDYLDDCMIIGGQK